MMALLVGAVNRRDSHHPVAAPLVVVPVVVVVVSIVVTRARTIALHTTMACRQVTVSGIGNIGGGKAITAAS